MSSNRRSRPAAPPTRVTQGADPTGQEALCPLNKHDRAGTCSAWTARSHAGPGATGHRRDMRFIESTQVRHSNPTSRPRYASCGSSAEQHTCITAAAPCSCSPERRSPMTHLGRNLITFRYFHRPRAAKRRGPAPHQPPRPGNSRHSPAIRRNALSSPAHSALDTPRPAHSRGQ